MDLKLLTEYKAMLDSMRTLGDKNTCGLYCIIAKPNAGKTYASQKLAEYLRVELKYVNEPDAKSFLTFQQLEDLVVSSSEAILVVDSMSIMEWSTPAEVAALMKDSTSGSRSEGISPSFIVSLVHLSQLARKHEKWVWISFSLADYKDINWMFEKFIGYSCGAMLLHGREQNYNLTCTFRFAKERSVYLSGLNIDELLKVETPLTPTKEFRIDGQNESTIKNLYDSIVTSITKL